MKTNKANRNAVVKALKKANRELEMERHGADHPWVAVDRPHKNRKKYNRKDQKKELRRDLGSFFRDWGYHQPASSSAPFFFVRRKQKLPSAGGSGD